MTNVYCVRADYGTYTQHFMKGGFVGIGFISETDLSSVRVKEDLYSIYQDSHPEEKNKYVVGQQVGQVARFLLDMKPGDYVVTPAADSDWLHYGKIAADPSYFYAANPVDGCRYHQRRRVNWNSKRLNRNELSIPFQHALGAGLTVFAIPQTDEFFEVIGEHSLIEKPKSPPYDSHRVVINQLLELHATEFEQLIKHLLVAIGFEGCEHVGKPGDGGVDATGELNVANLAKVKVFVQAKRYKLGTTINGNVVRQLRQSIPNGGQGAFITTADFAKKANDIAIEPGFPRIGLINGRQLVELLAEHWDDIDEEFRNQLGLRKGLVRI